MLRHTLLIAAAALFAAPSLAQAQSSSLFGNRGVTGSSGTLSNGVGGNRAGGGTSAAGNSGSMQGFTGSTAGSQSGFLSGAQSTSGSGLAGAGNRGFVGNRGSSASTQGANGQLGGANRGAAGRGGLSGLSRANSGRQNRGNQNRGAASGAQSTPVRPVMVMSFDPPAKNGQHLVTSIQSDLSSAVAQGRLPGIAVEADDQGTVTLNGHVATESDRRKAERLVRLEPGVRNVVNRITVQPPAQ